MTQKPKKATSEERSPLAVLRDIQQGIIHAKALSTDSRRACVEHLTADGLSAAEISEILKISPRTVFRDLQLIREAHAVERNPQVVKELVGQVVLHARHAALRLRRIGRDRATPAAAQVEAELGAWRVMKELTELLQKLGILPLAAQEIRADLTHRVEETPSLLDLTGQFRALEEVWREAGGPEALKPALTSVEGLLAKAEAAEQVHAIEARLEATPEDRQAEEETGE